MTNTHKKTTVIHLLLAHIAFFLLLNRNYILGRDFTFYKNVKLIYHEEKNVIICFFRIGDTKAAKLFHNDHNTRLSQIGKSATTFEEKAIHFKLETLTNYINHLESIAISKNIPITGVSFVFGADANGKRTTFLMPSTRNAKLDYQESFTIENGQFLTFKHIEPILKTKVRSVNDENLVLSTNGYLSFNEASLLFNNYQTQYIQPLKAKVKKEYYTKAVWYSLDELKGYLKYLQNQSNKHNLAITGVAVFFGVYNTDASLELKSNAQTVFLAASTLKQTIINNNRTSLKSIVTDHYYQKDADVDGSLTYNLGELSPPPKD